MTFPMPFFSPLVAAAVTPTISVSFLDEASDGTSKVTYTFSGMTLAEGFVIVSAHYAMAGNTTLASATIAGETATIHAQANGTNSGVAILSAILPAGTTTGSVSITYNANPARAGVMAHSATNVSSAAPTDTAAPGGGADAARSATLDVGAGGVIFAAVTTGNGLTGTWTNATQLATAMNVGDSSLGGVSAYLLSDTNQTDASVSYSSCRAIAAVSWV